MKSRITLLVLALILASLFTPVARASANVVQATTVIQTTVTIIPAFDQATVMFSNGKRYVIYPNIMTGEMKITLPGDLRLTVWDYGLCETTCGATEKLTEELRRIGNNKFERLYTLRIKLKTCHFANFTVNVGEYYTAAKHGRLEIFFTNGFSVITHTDAFDPQSPLYATYWQIQGGRRLRLDPALFSYAKLKTSDGEMLYSHRFSQGRSGGIKIDF